MIRTLATLAARLGVCLALAWAAWRFHGETGMVGMLPLFGIALAKPLLDLASDIRHALRAANWRELEGRHYAFRGSPVRVVEDADRRRWVRLADVRKVVGHSARNASLQLTYPRGWRRLGTPPEPYLDDDSLLEHLGKRGDAAAIRFRRWVEREIAFPGRRDRERLGIRVGASQRRIRSTSAVVE